MVTSKIQSLLEEARTRGYFSIGEHPRLSLALAEYQELMGLLQEERIPFEAPVVSAKEAATIINDLRKGIPPSKGISHISVGRTKLFGSIRSDLGRVAGGSSMVRFLNADLGQGKTHLLYLIRDFAFSQDFVVSTVTLSQSTSPLHQLLDVYRAILWGLRTAEEPTKPALESVLDRWLREMRDLPHDRSARIVRGLHEDIQNALIAYHDACNPIRPSKTKALKVLEYLSGGKVYLRDLRAMGISGRIDEAEALRMVGAVGRLFRNLKYRGLCVLFDEAEAIHSLSRIAHQEQAYENLLRMVTETTSFPYCYFIYSTTPSFFDAYSRFWPQSKWIGASDIYELDSLPRDEKRAIGQKILMVYASVYGDEAIVKLGKKTDQILFAAADKFPRIGEFVRAIVAMLDEAKDASP